MAKLQIFKETALPGNLQANSIYLVAPPGKPDYVEMYVTGTSASTVKRIIDAEDIQAMIDASLTGIGVLEIVADIPERNALTLTQNTLVLVLNATGDATVASGAATYAYRHSNTSWTKISEAEGLDVALSWANIANKPNSTVADIDDAVAKKHTHTNKTQLDKIGEDANGDLTYNSQPVATAWGSAGW